MKASCGISTWPNWRIFFLPFFCFSSSLRLLRDVAAVALGEHVLAQRADGLARDDAPADRRLDRDLEQVRRDQLLQLLAPWRGRGSRRARGAR